MQYLNYKEVLDMSIVDTLGRIPKIMEANLNALLDKCEDPAKMIDQLLVDYKRDLADVKRDTVKVMADLEMAKKQLDDCDKEISRKTTAAQNAIKAGNEDDARTILQSKQNLEASRMSLQQNYDVCDQNAAQMKQAYSKLVADIDALENRKNAAKAKISIAKAQTKISNTASKASSSKVMDSFAKYEEKAERALAEATANAQIDAEIMSVEDLTDKYASAGNNASVEDELARMKAEMGIQ